MLEKRKLLQQEKQENLIPKLYEEVSLLTVMLSHLCIVDLPNTITQK